MPPSKIRFIPKLSIATSKAKLDSDLSTWCFWRTITHRRDGNLELQMAMDAFTAMFHYSKSAVYQVLTRVGNIFWAKRCAGGVNEVQMKIWGLKRVVEYLNTCCGGYFVEIPIDVFWGHKGQRSVYP